MNVLLDKMIVTLKNGFTGSLEGEFSSFEHFEKLGEANWAERRSILFRRADIVKVDGCVVKSRFVTPAFRAIWQESGRYIAVPR